MKKQKREYKSFAARVLGETPSSSQRGCFSLMALSLILWPMAFSFPFLFLTILLIRSLMQSDVLV